MINDIFTDLSDFILWLLCIKEELELIVKSVNIQIFAVFYVFFFFLRGEEEKEEKEK